jgi:hypothetical protein
MVRPVSVSWVSAIVLRASPARRAAWISLVVGEIHTTLSSVNAKRVAPTAGIRDSPPVMLSFTIGRWAICPPLVVSTQNTPVSSATIAPSPLRVVANGVLSGPARVAF